MDFLEVIKETSKDELDDIVKLRIEYLEEQSLKYNGDVDIIGYLVDYNSNNYSIVDLEPFNEFNYSIICDYSGYIRKGIKIVYGFLFNGDGSCHNNGRYYCIDDDSYINEFCKYIKYKAVEDEYHLFNYVLAFSKEYFKTIEKVSREDMFKRIYKTDNIAYQPINEHKFSWFKDRGNAKCTEYSVLAQNILSFFGFDMHIMIGNEKNSGEKSENHAFNLVSFQEKNTKNIYNGLIDFSYHTYISDYSNEVIGILPYYIPLETIDEDFIKGFIQGDIRISYPEYECMMINKELIQVVYNSDRNYFMIEDKLKEIEIKTNKKVLKKDKRDV